MATGVIPHSWLVQGIDEVSLHLWNPEFGMRFEEDPQVGDRISTNNDGRVVFPAHEGGPAWVYAVLWRLGEPLVGVDVLRMVRGATYALTLPATAWIS